MAKRSATVTIRVSSSTLAALDMLVGELRAKKGKKVTQDEAIWAAIEKAEPHITARVEELEPTQKGNEGNRN